MSVESKLPTLCNVRTYTFSFSIVLCPSASQQSIRYLLGVTLGRAEVVSFQVNELEILPLTFTVYFSAAFLFFPAALRLLHAFPPSLGRSFWFG